MQNVKVHKEQALAILKKNRDAHHKIFLESVDGYKKQAILLLEQHIARIKKGRREQVSVHLPSPEEHTKDYDRAIKMLEMHVDDVLEFDNMTFQQYIMDDW